MIEATPSDREAAAYSASMTLRLEDPEWKPSRSNYVAARNKLRELEEELAAYRVQIEQGGAPAHPLERMVALDEEIEAKHPGWMTGQPGLADDDSEDRTRKAIMRGLAEMHVWLMNRKTEAPGDRIVPESHLAAIEVFLRNVEALAALQSTSAHVPDGWALVPVKPTQEMIEAALDDPKGCSIGEDEVLFRPADCWSAMLSAAPPLQSPATGEG